MKKYEPWIWTELVAFDHASQDFGVKTYLDRLGFSPHTICLFVSAPDFILSFDSSDENVVLPKDCCVYGVYSMDPRRNIQPWKMCEVKGLIEELHKYNIKVLVSVMTWYMFNKMRPEWLDNNLEILSQPREGGTGHSINSLKHFKDGTLFEDFFLKQITACMDYYGFDGWHAADGWGPTMYCAYDADFSDDFINQFIDYSKIKLPTEILPNLFSGQYPKRDKQGKIEEPSEEFKSFIAKRYEYIWNNCREEWLDFYTNRWADFFIKFTKEFKKKNRIIMVNSSMTRDPFEAKYRYGIDYKKIADTGIDGFIVETGACAQDLMSGDRNRHYDYTSTFLNIKAYCPKTKLIFLHVVQDHCENFDGIGHNPNGVEKEVYALLNMLIYKDNSWEKCADGFMVCLGDGIREDQWKQLRSFWEAGWNNPKEGSGPTLIFSHKAFEKQLPEFISKRTFHNQKILHKITEGGAPIFKTCHLENIEKIEGTVLILNSQLLDDEELALLFKKEKVIIIGQKDKRLPKATFYLEDNVEKNPLALYVYGINISEKYEITRETKQLMVPEYEPHFFVHELEFNPVTDDFIRACADVINNILTMGKVLWCGETYGRENHRAGSDGDEWKKTWPVKVWTLKISNNKYRLIVKNDYYAYREVDIDMGKIIKETSIVSEYPFAPCKTEGSIIKHLFVPNFGAEIIDVEVE